VRLNENAMGKYKKKKTMMKKKWRRKETTYWSGQRAKFIHKGGRYFTKRHRFLGRGRKERMRKLLRGFDCSYILLGSKKCGRDYFQVPKCFRKGGNLSM
jgi:hypothetical protein